jgi:cardiolipin synthase
MRRQGINVCEYNPLSPLAMKASRRTQRDHRKLLVVDGRVAFTGGINISNEYSRSSFMFRHSKRRPSFDQTREGWRDTQVEIRGPAVPAFQELFMNTWSKQHCPAMGGGGYFPQPRVEGDKLVRVIGTSPDDAENLIYLELLSAIRHAERSVHITMAYFVPDNAMVDALADAARRGVDVRLILPSATYLSIVFNAGRSRYAGLLAAGVRIYERENAPLHAKTVVIDGVWSTVGSANMDWLSFLHNDEVNAVVLGEDFAVEMERMFTADLGQSVAIRPDRWRRRGLWPRIKESVSRLLEYWL